MIIGYEMFRSLTKAALDNTDKARWKTQVRSCLLRMQRVPWSAWIKGQRLSSAGAAGCGGAS